MRVERPVDSRDLRHCRVSHDSASTGPRSHPLQLLRSQRRGFGGGSPQAGLSLAADGSLYGTSYGAGSSDPDGSVFELIPKGNGYSEQVLHRLGSKQGALLQAPVLLEPDGDIYGTTAIGGEGCSGTGCGTVFELIPSASHYDFRVRYRFSGPPDGVNRNRVSL